MEFKYSGPRPVFFCYYGGKQRLVPWLLENLPKGVKDMTYVEPCFGSGALFFSKSPSKKEVISDKDDGIYSFYKYAKAHPDILFKNIKRHTSFKAGYDRSFRIIHGLEKPKDDLDKALAVWEVLQYGYVNSTKKTFYVSVCFTKRNDRIYDRRNKTQSLHSRFRFFSYLFNRLKPVTVYNSDILEMIDKYDSKNTFFYIDPPYPGADQAYTIKYSNEEFIGLIEKLEKIKGKFMLSFTERDWMEIPKQFVKIKKMNYTTMGTPPRRLRDGSIEKENFAREETLLINYQPPQISSQASF